MTSALPTDELRRLARGEHHDPHAILGTHDAPGGTGQAETGEAVGLARTTTPITSSTETSGLPKHATIKRWITTRS